MNDYCYLCNESTTRKVKIAHQSTPICDHCIKDVVSSFIVKNTDLNSSIQEITKVVNVDDFIKFFKKEILKE